MYLISVILTIVFIGCFEAGVSYHNPNHHNYYEKYHSSPLDLFAYDDLEHELHELHDLNHGLHKHEHDFLEHGLFKPLLNHYHHLHKRSAHYNYKPIEPEYNHHGPDSEVGINQFAPLSYPSNHGGEGFNQFAPLNHHVQPVAVSHQSRVDIRGPPSIVAAPVFPAKHLVQVPAPVVQVIKYVAEPVYPHEPHVGHSGHVGHAGHNFEGPVNYGPFEHGIQHQYQPHHHYHY